jgi:hypothetical protein
LRSAPCLEAWMDRMCFPYRLFVPVLLVTATSCSGGLTLPGDGSPVALRVVSGDGQEGMVGTKLSDPLVVKLTDASSRPMVDVPIVFAFTSAVPAAQVNPGEATTDSGGVARAEVRLGNEAGSHEIEARVASSAELSTTFVVTALARDPGKKNRGGHGDDEGD